MENSRSGRPHTTAEVTMIRAWGERTYVISIFGGSLVNETRHDQKMHVVDRSGEALSAIM